MRNKFYRVSEQEFSRHSNINVLEIELPKRGTHLSAGYDFIAYEDITIKPGETKTIPTGIKAEIKNNQFLAILPRSGHGFKYRLQLDNTVGVIDADYFNNSDNEGHIFVKLTNDTKENKELIIKKGQGFCQGIFITYDIVEDDETFNERVGGTGSTDK